MTREAYRHLSERMALRKFGSVLEGRHPNADGMAQRLRAGGRNTILNSSDERHFGVGEAQRLGGRMAEAFVGYARNFGRTPGGSAGSHGCARAGKN